MIFTYKYYIILLLVFDGFDVHGKVTLLGSICFHILQNIMEFSK